MLDIKFSVLLSVYYRENPVFLREALNSIIDQSLPPTEIVLVKDGPLNEDLEQIILDFESKYCDTLKVITLSKNVGLGNALKIGMDNCSHELIARMDTDDISLFCRFKKQVDFLVNNPQISVVGSVIEEFNEIPGDLGVLKRLPEDSDQLVIYSKQRSPVNHPSIMFRKSAVLSSGGYNGDFRLFEDYSLFARMITKGFKFYNIQEPLLYFRIGNGMETIKRRSGWGYMRSEVRFLSFAYGIGHFNTLQYIKALCVRIPIRLLPPIIVLKIYSIFLRK